jgi:hypothetical protein
MYARILQLLHRAVRREYWLALAPVFILTLIVAPYLLWMPLIALTAPDKLQDDWADAYGLIFSGLVLVGFCLWLMLRWVARLGYQRALELLQDTDILLYALIQDTSYSQQEVVKPVLEVETLANQSREPGAFMLRLIRLATHFDRWSRAQQQRYILRPVCATMWTINMTLMLVALVLACIDVDTFIWLWALLLMLPVSLIYLHVTGCGKRIGALRALAQFLSEEA